ncbi:hypothetical protein PMZ80_010051 [Knufia obscura]|uniref:Clr5 domain-containing protein n=1 Tax=Knufia obscura TaxID=1635080 RepID=A0ABR0RBD4_9EURO|nr:hypothetical protein PMZ80_010051 [Knufia obscura]
MPTAAQWEEHKELLRDLYMEQGKSAVFIQRQMRTVHQFDVSIGQYQRMFKRWRFVKNIKISPKNWMALSEELKRQVLKVDDVDIYFQGNFIKTESAKEALYRYDTSLLPSVKSQTLSDAVLKDILTQMLLLAFPISMAQNEDFEQEVLPALTDTAPLTRFTQSICAEAFDSISVEQPVKLSTATAPTWRIDLKSETSLPDMLRCLRAEHNPNSGHAFATMDNRRRTEWVVYWLWDAITIAGDLDWKQMRQDLADCESSVFAGHIRLPTLVKLAFIYCLAADPRPSVRNACFQVLKTCDIRKLKSSNKPVSRFLGRAVTFLLSQQAVIHDDSESLFDLLSAGAYVELDHSLHSLNWFPPAVGLMSELRITGRRSVELEGVLCELLKAGTDTTLRGTESSESGRSRWRSLPYFLALELKSSSAIAKSLLETGAVKPRSADLSKALKAGSDISIVRDILEAGISANWDVQCTPHSSLYQPLIHATEAGALDLVRLLIEHGARPNVVAPKTNISKYSPPDWAVDLPHWYCRLSPLAIAAARGDIEIMGVLLDAGADVNFCFLEDALAPLQAAIMFRRQESVKFLFRNTEINFEQATKISYMRGPTQTFRPFYLALLTMEFHTLGYIMDQELTAAISIPNSSELLVVQDIQDLLKEFFGLHALRWSAHLWKSSVWEAWVESPCERLYALTQSERALLERCCAKVSTMQLRESLAYNCPPTVSSRAVHGV